MRDWSRSRQVQGDAERSIGLVAGPVRRHWGVVLGRETVAADVPLLDYGGDSLQAMQILVRLCESLKVGMTSADFFALPTVELQARYLESLIGARQ